MAPSLPVVTFCAVESLAIFFIHVTLTVLPRARAQLLVVRIGEFHSSNAAFPLTREFLSASARQLRFVTASYLRQVVKRKKKSAIFHGHFEVHMRTAISHDP